MSVFKPNLIPNSKVDKPINIPAILKKLGRSISDYIVSYKKDGCRIEFVDGEIKTRALKPVLSSWIQQRYAKLAQVCKENDVILEGEFYAHGMKFNEICRFFKTENVTELKHMRKLQTDCTKFNIRGTKKDPIWDKPSCADEEKQWRAKGFISKFEEDWPGRTISWLSTYHEDLKVWPFDCYLKNYPELKYQDRMNWLIEHITHPKGIFHEFKDILSIGSWFNITPGKPSFTEFEKVQEFYEDALEADWEGLVLTYKNRTYKFGRSTANEGDIFKLKEDKLEYDGKVLDIIEGTIAREGAPKTVNELGRSVTSKLAEDRVPSGRASGIESEYNGHPITVSFEGYSHEELKDILENKQDYIGQWFTYTGMKPVAKVPRHAHCKRDSWRDEKGAFEK